MGQIVKPGIQDIILSDVDRLVARNADGGLSPAAAHVILLGEDAGENLSISNAIGLGFNSLGANGTGIADTPTLDGSIAIGQNCQGALTSAGTVGVIAAANITIGRDSLASAVFASSNVIIGDNAVELAVGSTGQPINRNVIIGANAMGNATPVPGTQIQRTVVIGDRAGRPAAGSEGKDLFQSVVIGADACSNYTAPGGNGLNGATLIGAGAGLNITAASAATLAVAVGLGAGASIASASCIAIGATSDCLGSAQPGQIAIGGATRSGGSVALGWNASIGVTSSYAIAIGQQAGSDDIESIALGAFSTITGGAAGSIAIGYNAVIGVGAADSISIGRASASYTGIGNIRIGSGCGNAEPAANAHRFIIETFIGAVRRGALYADMADGNVIAGLSTPAVDRDTPGTNILKLLNGTATGNPVGGGMFYVTAGELTWRSPGGVDYLLTPHGSRGTFAVAALPAANLIQGQRAYVNDALAPVFGTAVAGGGAVFVPVFYDGAAWIVG